MTREQVVQMANEAGLPALTEYGYGCLFRVIKRSREDMREQCAKVCEENDYLNNASHLAMAIRNLEV